MHEDNASHDWTDDTTDDSRRSFLRGLGATAGAAVVGGLSTGTAGAAGDGHSTTAEEGTPGSIDGTKDSAWDDANAISLDNDLVGSPSNSDVDGTAYTLWDSNSLYVFVEATDDTSSQDSSDFWHDDSVAVYVDVGDADNTSYSSNDYKFNFRADGSSFTETNGNTGPVQNWSTSSTSAGYNLEVELSWSDLGVSSPADGDSHGFDVHVNDDDDGGDRDAKIAWNDTDDDAWQDPSSFGTLTLNAASGGGGGGESVDCGDGDGSVTVNRVTTAPSVDGTRDSVYDNGQCISVKNNSLYDSATDDDLDAIAETVATDTDWYVFVEVVDDTMVQDSSSGWKDDSVAIFVDVGNDDGSSYGSNDYQFRFQADGSNLSEKNGNTGAVTSWSTNSTSKGYNVEVAFSFSDLGTTPSDGDTHGFDVHVNDDDDGGDRDSKITWHDGNDDAWQDPSVFGDATLSGSFDTGDGGGGGGGGTSGIFSVSGTTIYDPDGNEYVPLGANVGGPRYSWGRDTVDHIDYFETHWNLDIARVNWYPIRESTNKGGWELQQGDSFSSIVDTYTGRDVVVLPEVHDYTGGLFQDAVDDNIWYGKQELLDFWVDLAQTYKDNPYVWFNIMNEPGDGDSDQYYDDWVTWHNDIIQAVRNEGFDNPIVVDGMYWGQDAGATWDTGPVAESESAILSHGDQIDDPADNVIFSFHIYDQWIGDGSDDRVDAFIDDAHAKDFALFVGEYGESGGSDQDDMELCEIGLDSAYSKGVGSAVWHFQPGDGFDLTEGNVYGWGTYINDTDNPTNLTWWQGEPLWDLAHGGSPDY